jgi:hypothetical protein
MYDALTMCRYWCNGVPYHTGEFAAGGAHAAFAAQFSSSVYQLHPAPSSLMQRRTFVSGPGGGSGGGGPQVVHPRPPTFNVVRPESVLARDPGGTAPGLALAHLSAPPEPLLLLRPQNVSHEGFKSSRKVDVCKPLVGSSEH